MIKVAYISSSVGVWNNIMTPVSGYLEMFLELYHNQGYLHKAIEACQTAINRFDELNLSENAKKDLEQEIGLIMAHIACAQYEKKISDQKSHTQNALDQARKTVKTGQDFFKAA